jgi:hypothetical protein
MKPTPGPWRAECVGSEGGENPLDVYEVNNGHRRIAEYVSEPDARLIAAAPDMLDALRAIADPTVRTDGVFAQMAIDRFRAIANAAIARATGDQP